MSGNVLIRGHVFTYDEKAPFVPSGLSVLGAIEYDVEKDELKCHECGEWFSSVGRHIRSHKITSRAYKLKHGLNVQRSSLSGRILVKQASDQMKQQMQTRPNPLLTLPQPRPRRLYTPNPRIELANESGRCRAQLLYRIQILAAQVNHTPTKWDLKAASMNPTTVIHHFGSLGHAMQLCGLTPNTGRKTAPSRLPFGFATKLKWDNARMPWPAGHDSITEDDAFARVAASA